MFKNTNPLNTRIFISAERFELGPLENQNRTTMLQSLLGALGFEFQRVEGSYTEVHADGGLSTSYEQSFMVFTESRIPKLMELAKHFEQHSILVVTHNSTGYLIKQSGTIENIEGRFVRLPANHGLVQYTVIDGEQWGFQVS